MADKPYNVGTVVLYKNISTWTGKLQRLWWRITRQPYKQYSHLSVCAGQSTLGRELEAEANVQVDQTTFKYNSDQMDLFMPLAIDGDIYQALNEAIDAHEEKSYGYISWLTIVIRGIFEMLGFKNVKSWNILWGWGVMCSEFGWYYMNRLSELSIKTYDNDDARIVKWEWVNFRRELLSYNPNTFTPIDARVLMSNHPLIWFNSNIFDSARYKLGEWKTPEFKMFDEPKPDNYYSYDLGVLRGYRH